MTATPFKIPSFSAFLLFCFLVNALISNGCIANTSDLEDVENLDLPYLKVPVTEVPVDPSPFIETMDHERIRKAARKIDSISSVGGGPAGRHLNRGMVIQGIGMNFETQLAETAFQETLLKLFKQILEEEEVTYVGESSWTPPTGLSVFYETEGRYGGIHCVISESPSGFWVMTIVQEGLDASFLFEEFLEVDE